MVHQGYRFIDSDMHILEPDDLWLRCIEPRFRDQAPRGITGFVRDPSLEWRGERLPRRPAVTEADFVNKVRSQAERYARDAERGWDSHVQLEAMDKEGIDRAVLFPTRGLFVVAFPDMEPALAAACCRAYNDWMFDFCKPDPHRLVGAALLAPHDIAASVIEARRAVKELGFKGVVMRPNPIGGRYFHQPEFDPLWAELQSLNVPLCFHEGGSGNCPIESTGRRFGGVFTMGHVVSHPLEQMQACVAMCSGGVLERFPRLRVGFLEANCAWVPWLLWRMDEHAEFAGLVKGGRLAPSQYFKRSCYVSIESDEEIARDALRYLEGGNVVFSTDYPHLDSKFPRATERFLELGLPADYYRKILWDNCAALYALD